MSMETAQYILNFFFNWTDGGFWHFLQLGLLCWLLGSPSIVNIHEGNTDNGTQQ